MSTYRVVYRTWPTGKIDQWKAKTLEFEASNDERARKYLKDIFGEQTSPFTSERDDWEYEMSFLTELRNISLR